jgi:hypothetical protein
MFGLAVRFPEREQDDEKEADDQGRDNMRVVIWVDVGPDDAHEYENRAERE